MTAQQNPRPGVNALQLASLLVLFAGVVGIFAALDALSGSAFGDDGAATGEKWVFGVTAAVPVVVGSGILFGLARIVDLLYDLRDGRQTPAVQTAAPADGGIAY